MPETLAQGLPILRRQPGQAAIIQRRRPDEEAATWHSSTVIQSMVGRQSVSVSGQHTPDSDRATS
jgi:hypothetical protein